MIDLPYLSDICRPTPSKIVLLVVDGLGGAPHPDRGVSELEAASIPNLDALAAQSAAGLTTPVAHGVTPGSGPGHMALFGYDPVKYLMGRGVLEAIGTGVPLAPGDIAARGNLCHIDPQGNLTDRRAGRIPTAESAPLIRILDEIQIPRADISAYPVQDYRFVLVIRGENLDDRISETDPQAIGVPPLRPQPLSPSSTRAADAAAAFADAAKDALKGQGRANMILLRGFSQLPNLPSFAKQYRLNPAAVAAYPMYRGLAQLVGMRVIPTGKTFDDELDTLQAHWNDHDFFFLHYKPADAAGEDGDFDAKVATLEALDACMPRITALNPDALIVAGDHATPAILAAHSWHPVPLLIHSPITRADGIPAFTERHCAAGSLGRIPATSVMLLALAHADKLLKYGP